MTFELRLLIVGLTAFALTNLAVSAVLALGWRRADTGDGAPRARRLAWLRALPVTAALSGTLWATTAFAIYEPRRSDETFGILLTGLASVPAVLLAAAAWRWLRATWHAQLVQRRWLRDAEPIALDGTDLPAVAIPSSFPVVAVMGLFRPRLVIARSVIAACTPLELRAIVAHEQAHVVRRDNWTRLALTVLPDVLGWLPASRQLTASWHAAAEDAADDGAGSLGRDGRLALAQALIRVARMAPAETSAAATDARLLPATALFRGDDIARRVQRLVAPAGTDTARRRRLGLGVAAATAALALSAVLMKPLHHVVETIVTILP